MRTTIRLSMPLAIILVFLGCSSKKTKAENHKQKAEQLMDQLQAEFNQLASAIEKGDKVAAYASITKLSSISKQTHENAAKLTKAEDEELFKRSGGNLNGAMDRFMNALKSAATNNRFSQTEIQEIVRKVDEVMSKK